jgi:hypothetical protein
LFDVADPENLGIGHDVPKGPWKRQPGTMVTDRRCLRVAAAWRIENKSLWLNYLAGRNQVEKDIGRLKTQLGSASVARLQTEMASKISPFWTAMGEPQLMGDVNEVLLGHATDPENLVNILSEGCSEKFCGGLFGKCVYFAETPCKNDQYAKKDTHSSRELHELLYPRRQDKSLADVYFIIICRVVMGHFVRTQDGLSNMDSPVGKSVWRVEDTELTEIDGTTPGIRYHGMVAETGIRIKRHREFLQYHSNRIYPTYLVAYKREVNGRDI